MPELTPQVVLSELGNRILNNLRVSAALIDVRLDTPSASSRSRAALQIHLAWPPYVPIDSSGELRFRMGSGKGFVQPEENTVYPSRTPSLFLLILFR